MVIDAEETKRSLFGGLKSSTPKTETPSTPEVLNSRTSNLPKWKTLEKVTVLLTNRQRDAIEDLARIIMRKRPQASSSKEERERITANTVVRALIDNLIETVSSLKMQDIKNEDELKLWLRQLFEIRE
jgi:hypothetical protein